MDAGTVVEIMEQGKWVGPFTVTAQAGRTPDHLVLSGPAGSFEHYADAPFNVRPVEAPAHEGSGVKWGGKRPAADEFGPWIQERHESMASGRDYLLVRRLESTPGVVRYHRNKVGAPIWYTLDGAKRKAAALNAAG